MSYGRPDINECIDYLRHRTGVPLDRSKQQNRNDCKRLLDTLWREFQPLDPVVLAFRLIDIAVEHPDHSGKATSMWYIDANMGRLIKLGMAMKKSKAKQEVANKTPVVVGKARPVQ